VFDVDEQPDDFAPLAGGLSAYLLGPVDFAASIVLQRRLAYDISGTPGAAAVVICEHPLAISYGRTGSRLQVRLTDEELHGLECSQHWVARGGGAMLHLPGQLAVYPVLRLEEHHLTPGDYVRRLMGVASDLVHGLGLPADVCNKDDLAIRVRGRRVASIGVGVSNGITRFGLFLNVCPDLALFHEFDCDGDQTPMTSFQRESPTPIRPAAVRQRVIELLAAAFSWPRVSIFHHHPNAHPIQTRFQYRREAI